MFNEAFTPKEVQELLMKLRVNPEKKDKDYPAGEEWKKYIHVTTGKNGAYKGKKLTYIVLELDGVAGQGAKSGKKMIAATIGNHVRTVFKDFDQKLFGLLLDQLKAGAIDNDTRELEVCIEGSIYTEPCGFEYTVKIDGTPRKRSSVKVICLLDENDKAADMIAAEIKIAEKTKLTSQADDKKAEEFKANQENGNNNQNDDAATSDDDEDL
jgi:signal recognition particle subunit SEC65